MMSRFDACFHEVMLREGRYGNDPDDPGGETHYGISARVARSHGYEPGEINIPTAKSIYRSDYWDVFDLDAIGSGELAFEIFDTAVNLGPARSIEILQRAINILNIANLEVDGSYGPLTWDAVRKTERLAYARHLVAAMNGLQFDYYVELSAYRPQMQKFLRGWMLRCIPFDPEV